MEADPVAVAAAGAARARDARAAAAVPHARDQPPARRHVSPITAPLTPHLFRCLVYSLPPTHIFATFA